ncbi:168_t:CDS:2, partial [Scutellospora calospora]
EFNELILKHYHSKSNYIQKIKYQFENNYNIDELKVLINNKRYDPNHDVKIINKHIQGFCMLTKQERIGRYIKKNEKYKTKKGVSKIARKEMLSGIKGLFKNNTMHLDYNNGTIQEAFDYVGKDFNRYFLHHNSKTTPCKCNLFDQNSCSYEFGEIAKTKNIEGKNQHTKKWKELTKDIEEQNLTKDKILVKYNSDIKTLTATTKGIEDVYNTFQNINKRPMHKRCWKTCNIYIYGVLRTGKSYLAQILFPDAYDKSNEDGKWYLNFNKNNEYDVVIYNEFSGSDLKYIKLLNLLDRRDFSVQFKDGNVNYMPKVQVFIANSSLREQYTYYEDIPFVQYSNGYKVTNRKYYSAASKRFDYIIEYFKFRDDNKQPCNDKCLCCKVCRIFHKGSYDNFINFRFDIEFNSNITIEKAEEIVYYDD